MPRICEKLRALNRREWRILSVFLGLVVWSFGAGDLHAGLVVPWGDEGLGIQGSSVTVCLESSSNCESGCSAAEISKTEEARIKDRQPERLRPPFVDLIESGGGASAPPTSSTGMGSLTSATAHSCSVAIVVPELTFSRLVELAQLRLPSPPLAGLLDPPKISL